MNKQLKKAIKAKDFEKFTEILEDEKYEDEIDEIDWSEMLCLAAEVNSAEITRCIVEDYIENINDGNEGNCPALDNATDPDVRSILFDHGAIQSSDYYDDMKFSVCTNEWGVYAFDMDFRRDIINKIIEKHKTEEIDDDTLDRYKETLFFEIVDGAVVSEDRDCYEFDGVDLFKIIQDLGYSYDFEGEQWKLGTNGFYFIQ